MVEVGRIRVDRWLFFARVAKSRTLAAKMVGEGRIRVNREKIDHASHTLKADDVLTIALDRRVLVLKLVAPGTRRGPAEEARTLYEDLTPVIPKEERPTIVAEREAGAGRPTKRDRRLIDRLREGED
jgi:ribosome-associated heat shock protein Hsp15